ncbi:MAG: metallophosphoesterase [Clostridia bacterium]|nr:metallophosphoesterase [Clostridia bacterium]
MKKLIALLLSLALMLGVCVCSFAGEAPYASVVTASDFQNVGSAAFDRFGTILGKMKADGLDKLDSVLTGGDYSLLLFNQAKPEIAKIRGVVLEAFPETDPNAVVNIQGNHDNPTEEFADTGFYDMGAYCLYAVNEDDFPWKQNSTDGSAVRTLAADIDSKLGAMIEAEDLRPVIVITHVPLHHTDRTNYGDNMYASYIFNVLNEKGKKLDIIFLFGHNHSGDYDDYIGGSVNFLAKGEEIRVPMSDKTGKDCYTNETLNFTYANCGYVGTSMNAEDETSTNELTAGLIQFCSSTIKISKYSTEGVFKTWTVEKINKNSSVKEPSYPSFECSCSCHSGNNILWNIYIFFCKLFGINEYCVCGAKHY